MEEKDIEVLAEMIWSANVSDRLLGWDIVKSQNKQKEIFRYFVKNKRGFKTWNYSQFMGYINSIMW